MSPNILERCAAAIILGLRHDERALPILEQYLLMDMPTVETEDPQTGKKIRHVQREAEGWFNSYRRYIAGALATFGPASLTPILRNAFLKHWRQKLQNKWPKDYSLTDSLLYPLGRRGALDVLNGIDMPDLHRRLSMLFLTFGALHADERFDEMKHEVSVNSVFKREVVSFCTAQFGLLEQEAKQYVDSHDSDYYERGKFNWRKDVPKSF